MVEQSEQALLAIAQGSTAPGHFQRALSLGRNAMDRGLG